MVASAASHRVLVVGGKIENVPLWARNAFDIDLILSEDGHGSGRGLLAPPTIQAEAVVIAVEFISHNYADQARKIARLWGVPWFGVRGGWSSAVERAALAGLDWFVNAAQQGVSAAPPGEAAELQNVVDSAWLAVVTYEREKTAAALRRLTKETRKRERLEMLVEEQKRAAERVVSELQRRHRAVLGRLVSRIQEAIDESRG